MWFLDCVDAVVREGRGFDSDAGDFTRNASIHVDRKVLFHLLFRPDSTVPVHCRLLTAVALRQMRGDCQ